MNVRKAKAHELDCIYAMGFDVWNDGLTFEEYLTACRKSTKYQSGTWYLLIDNDKIVSSLIVYSDNFGLKEGCFGVGSVATSPNCRGKGYASYCISSITTELFANSNCKAVYLHSDIGYEFYHKLGFVRIEGTDCMLYAKQSSKWDHSIPSYF
ncbi:GNAT family N-acetyltransferase [Vibrio sp. MA40-2]|uniref:GNAT family N-acetyltransferase n=1 Tax=Vibrio sp. MA40-2 TaxID=3391828 RepID=UPI0039A4644F